MRRALLVIAVGLAGCGGEAPRRNVPRPPAPVMLTAAVHDGFVEVSPARVGAGPIVLVVSNQSRRPQTVTFETQDVPGSRTVGRRASTSAIPARGTGRLKLNARQGHYMVHVADRRVRAARVRVGPRRESSQDDLLLP